MFYDLNILWTPNIVELQRTLAFSAELGYNVVAINHIIKGKLPTDLRSPIPNPLPFSTPPGLKILRRCTLVLADPSQNHRLANLSAEYDILALRPVTEKALQLANQSPEADLISMDMTQRLPFHFKHKQFSTALQYGVRLELTYGGGAGAGRGPAGAEARRNLISNATNLIRATRGRGLMLSSEAKRALECRGPFDVANLATVWGLSPERAREAITTEARVTVAAASSRRHSYRGVIELLPPTASQTLRDNAQAAADVVDERTDQEMNVEEAQPDVMVAKALEAGDDRRNDGDDDMLPSAKRRRSQRPPKRERDLTQSKPKQ